MPNERRNGEEQPEDAGAMPFAVDRPTSLERNTRAGQEMKPLVLEDGGFAEIPLGSNELAPSDDTSSRTKKKEGHVEIEQSDIHSDDAFSSDLRGKGPLCACCDRFDDRTDFWAQAFKLVLCIIGLLVTYPFVGFEQDALLATDFGHDTSSPLEGFAAFSKLCVFCNRLAAIIVAMVVVRAKHGAFFANNTAPMTVFTPMAIGNSMSSWAQHACLQSVSFTAQSLGKSTILIAVLLMGLAINGASYRCSQYVEAIIITVGLIIFSLPPPVDHGPEVPTELVGVLFLAIYIVCESFTIQWQERIYISHGRPNVDIFQMLLGVNAPSLCIAAFGLIISGDIPTAYEFIKTYPYYFTSIVASSIAFPVGQLLKYFLFKEIGPIAFTILFSVQWMIGRCIWSYVFDENGVHPLNRIAYVGAWLVFGVVLYKIRRRYLACKLQAETNRENAEWLERIDREREESERMVQEAGHMMQEIARNHLEGFLRDSPQATYEQWIKELHPENVEEESGEIDHRFYVKDSDHRIIWNEKMRAVRLRDCVEARTLKGQQVMKGMHINEEGDG